MITLIVDILLGSMVCYLLLGLLFSVYFYIAGASRLDEGTNGTPWHFKLIIFPGVVLFWGVLLMKILRKS